VLVELLGHALRLGGELAEQQRLQHLEGRAHQVDAGEAAAVPDEALVGDDRHQRVDAVVGPQLDLPPPLRRGAVQTDRVDAADLHAPASASGRVMA
jgi:hypothetical protein